MYRLGIGKHAADLTMHELLYSRKVRFLSDHRVSDSNGDYSGRGYPKSSTICPSGIIRSVLAELGRLVDACTVSRKPA